MKIRAFIAVDISHEARLVLSEIIERLQEQDISGARWVRSEGIHLTVKFLGDIEDSVVDKVLSAMERGIGETMPFNLALSELGAFPSLASPRVIWVGLSGEIDLLNQLHAGIDREVSTIEGFSQESRPFAPHLTLGRMRDHVSGEERRKAGKAISEVPLESEVVWKVSQVILVQSTLTQSGAVYRMLGSCLLNPS